MPIYQYRCEETESEIELVLSMKNDIPSHLERSDDESPFSKAFYETLLEDVHEDELLESDGLHHKSKPKRPVRPHPHDIETGKFPAGYYRRVYSFAVNIDSKQPKTVGDLAQRNTDEKIKRGELKPRKEKIRPWWRPKTDKVDTSLAKLNKKQKMNYIATGKK